MKHYFYLLLLGLLTGCGSSKNTTIATPPETPKVVTETRVEIPEPPSDINEPIITNEEVTKEEEQLEDKMEPTVETTVNTDVTATEEIIVTSNTVDHNTFNDILKKNVSPQGVVNYASIKANWSKLRNYIKVLGENTPQDTWSKDEKLSYWMNAYNAMTIDLILRNYPLESIKDIKDPWDQRFWKVGDKWINLNEIEHKILRKMDDPRIHFGINCASFSCPPLLNEAFFPNKVDEQLDTLARGFVNDTARNTITPDKVEVSKIFTWFAKDFKIDGSLIDYLNKYATTKIADNAKVRYRDYDWTLNN